MPTELKDEYRKVRFKCEQPEPTRHFFIITAYNPDGLTVSDQANKKADQSMQAEIARLGYNYFSVTGGSPDFSHAEPGYGLTCNREEALTLARQFRQDALFEVKSNRVFLVSALVDPVPDEDIGKWTELYHNL